MQLIQRLNMSDLPSYIWNLDESGMQDVFDANLMDGHVYNLE